MTEAAALTAAIVLNGLAIFYLLLALRFPLGKAAWSGKFTVLPWGLRAASAVIAGICVFVSFCVLERADMVKTILSDGLAFGVVWMCTVIFGAVTLMKANSQSRTERQAMTPVGLVLFAAFLIVSLTAG